MIFDSQNLFTEQSDGTQTQTIAVNSGATLNSTNIIDTYPRDNANAVHDLGAGEPIRIFAKILENVVGSGASLEVQLVSSDATNLGTPTVHATTGAVAITGLTAGTKLALPQFLPRGTYKRYLGILFKATGANITAGEAMIGLVFDEDSNNFGG